MPVCRAQLLLELESVHASHPHIENQACRLGDALRLQERFRRRKTFYPKANGSNQIIERIPQRVIIVDNRNERNSGHTTVSLFFECICRKIVSCSGAQYADSRSPLGFEHERPLENTLTSAGENCY